MAYSLKYYKEFTRNHGTHCLEIYEKDYSGSAIEIDNLQGDILITMDGSDITDAIIGSTLSFTIIDTSQIDYTEFFTPDSTKYKVVFKTNNTTRWTGYLTPDSYKENIAYREPITLTARDNTGRLNDFYFNEDVWQMMSISDILALARTTAGIDMPMSLNTQLYAGSTRAILTLINTTAFHNSTWREVVEKILSGIGCQMRWCDNNYIGIYDLSQLYDLDAEGATQQMRFINKSGYKEIKPAWRQLDITQDYQSRQNLYNSSDYLNESDYENMGTRTNYADIIAGKSWVAVNDGTIIGKEVQISNQWGYANDDQQKSIYIGVFHYCQIIDHINLGYNPNYVKLSKKIYRANKENVIIKFYANCTLRGVNLTPTQMDGELNLLKPTLSTTPNHYNFNKYTLQIYCNIIYTQVAGSTYILRKEWEVYDEAEPASNDDYLIFPLDENDWDTGYVNVDKEISIYIDTLPFADTSSGTLELRLYPVWADEYEPYGCCKISNFDISIGTSIKAGQHKRTTVNSEHNINQAIGVCIGQVPDDKVTSDNYLGGLFNEDSNALHPAPQSWKLGSTSQTTYNLLELVAREHIHFNKDNYLLLSGQMIPETLTDYIHFDRPFLYSATRYVPISFDYNVISNSINITKMQEVREYEVEDLTFEDVSDDDCGSSSSSGSSSSGGASSSGTTDHTRLANRDVSDQHPLSSITGLVDALAAKLDISIFSDLFEKVNIGTAETPEYAIKAKYGLYSDQFVSTLGVDDTEGSSGSYDRLDNWTDYDITKAGWVLSAGLGYDLNTRVASLESGSALSLETSGSGNAVTSVAKNGTVLTVNKGSTFALASHAHDYIPTSQKGTAGGVAELDVNGLVPSSQLPSYVDDVLEYSSLSAFPATGESGKIYVATDTNLTYRWSGTAYVEISASLALGETSSTAYRGDRGKTAYDHSQDSTLHLTAAMREVLALFEVQTDGSLKILTGLWSNTFLSCLGEDDTSGGSGVDLLSDWANYNATTAASMALAANLGYVLKTRITALENGSALDFTTTGAGNAVTSVVKNGTAVTITKGSTFALASHNHDSRYLSLDGGGIVENGNICINTSAGTYGLQLWDEDNNVSSLLTSDNNVLKWDSNNILHTGNYTNYAVPTTRTIAGLALSADVGVSSFQNALGLGTAAYTASTSYAAASHTHTKAQITDFPTSLPASDVYAWAKAATKPSYTAGEVGALSLSGGTMANKAGIKWNNNYQSWDEPNGFSCISSLSDTLGYYAGFSYKGYYGLQIRSYGGDTDRLTFRGGTHSAWGSWRTIYHTGNFNPANYLPLSGGTINGTLTVKHDPFNGVPSLSIGGPTRYLNLTGNAVIFDMSADGGVWESRMLCVKDPVSTTTGFGIYGGTEGLNYYYMGGTYSSPICKLYPSNRFEILKSGSIIPETTNIYNLGSASIKWANVYATTFIGALSGNASSATKLQTARTIWGQSFDGSGNVSGAMTGVSTISASGNITTNAEIYALTGIWTDGYMSSLGQDSSSDMRLKTAINDLSDVMPFVNDLHLFSHSWKCHKGRTVGLSAQRLLDTEYNFLVHRRIDGYYSVEYNKLSVIALKGLQEHDEEIRNLKDRVKILENKLKKYEYANS